MSREISWMRTSDHWREPKPRNDDFVAFDGDVVIWRVIQGASGPDRGSWTWSMTVDLPGPRFTARSGVEARRGDAGRRVVEAYEKLLRSRRLSPQDHRERHNRHHGRDDHERGDGELA